MRKSIKDLRLARGITQEALAQELKIHRGHLSRIEAKKKGISTAHLARLCEFLDCLPAEVDYIEPKPSGGQAPPAVNHLPIFRADPMRAPRPQWNSGARLASMRVDMPGFLGRFDRFLDEWRSFLDQAPSESRNETIFQLMELFRGAQTGEVSTNYLGFNRWCVVDQAGNPAGHLLRPALVTKDFVLVFQITVKTPKAFRMDALGLVLHPKRVFFNLEIDGTGHDGTKDRKRAGKIALRTVRIPAEELRSGPSLTERLRAEGLLPAA